MASKKRTRYCQLPTPGNIAGRSSSITNAFFNSIIPIHVPSDEEVIQALEILEIDPENITCAYCGAKSSEWDHFRAIINDQQPTGFITEIANLVPACGKCNQSKGKRDWKEWIKSEARLSPATRGVLNLEARIERLTRYEEQGRPTKIDFRSIVSEDIWQEHHTNWKSVIALLQESQKLAKQIREIVEAAPRHKDLATGQITYGVAAAPEDDVEEGPFFTHEEAKAKFADLLQSDR